VTDTPAFVLTLGLLQCFGPPLGCFAPPSLLLASLSRNQTEPSRQVPGTVRYMGTGGASPNTGTDPNAMSVAMIEATTWNRSRSRRPRRPRSRNSIPSSDAPPPTATIYDNAQSNSVTVVGNNHIIFASAGDGDDSRQTSTTDVLTSPSPFHRPERPQNAKRQPRSSGAMATT